jgi:hypothetical protein
MGKYRKHRVLRRLHVDEVSSVTRAANPGARVVLAKRWDGVGTEPGYDRGFVYTMKGDAPMREQPNYMRIAKGLGQAIDRGLDGDTFAKLQIDLANEMYPDDPQALSKLLNTHVGRDMITKAAQKHYENLQYMSRCGDADLVMQKADGNTPKVHHAQAEDQGVEEPYEKKHARLVAAGFSADEAHTMLHRTEKLKRGIS